MVDLLSLSGLYFVCPGSVGRNLFGTLLHLCAYFSLNFFLLGVHLRKLCGAFFVVVVAVFVPIVVDAFVLQVGIAAFGVVVIGTDVDVVVVVGQVLLLLQLVGVFRLLELFWLNEVLMSMLGQVPVVSSAEVLAVV